MNLKKLGLFVVALFAVSTLAFAIGAAPPLTNWSAPSTYTPAGRHLMSGEIGSGPFAFFPITPCRQYNSSGTPLTSGVDRTITLTGAPCGIPTSTLAVSVNITIFNISGAGGNGVVKIGTAAAPTTAWINYPSTETQRANAGAVPLNSSGQIVLQIAQGGGTADIIVDVNGYYYNGNQYMMPANDFFSIWGSNPGSMVLFGRNDSTGTGSTGVEGWVLGSGAGSAGVQGRALASSGSVSGVFGVTSSTGSLAAGVRGISGSGEPVAPAGIGGDIGVFGETNSGYAVAGIAGVGGKGAFFDLHDAAGNAVALSYVGYKPGATAYAFYALTGDYGGTGAKYFVEPHPTDSAKVIHYISLEGGEAGTYTRGTEQIVDGSATIKVPDDFRMVTEEEGVTVLLTPVGAQASMYIVSQDLNSIVVRSSRNVKFHYMINGVRRGYKNFQPVGDGLEFMPSGESDRIPAGLSAELKHRLVANGTYNEDGTVNIQTAEKMGWTKIWREKAEATARAAEAHRESLSRNPQGQGRH